MSLQDVLTLTKGDEEQINVIYRMTEKRLIGRLNTALSGVISIPEELDYVVDEVTISRFNRIGSEGMTSESVEGRSATYSDDDFAPYISDIDGYIKANKEPSKKGVVRFI